MAYPKVAVLGCGYWGKNLVRVMYQLGALEVVYDIKPEASQSMASEYGVKTTSDLSSIWDDESLAAVMIAAPAAQHYALVRTALQKGKDVYVEKPLALRTQEGSQLVALAAQRERILMVGHILQYHPAIVALNSLIRRGELGKLLYIYSSRLNLGRLRSEENILWSFAPHDIAAILAMLGEMPERVSAHGGTFISSKVADTTLTTCDFKSGVQAHVFVSWLHPFKEQKLCVIGDRKMAVFDDVEQERKLVLYSHRIQWKDRQPVAEKDPGQVIPLPQQEPLKMECMHFLECVQERRIPKTDGSSALQVLQVLQAAEESLQGGGLPVQLRPMTSYFAHPTAVIDAPCEIGSGTKIWHFSHIMAKSKLGKNCNLGQNVVISPEVQIGNNVKIQNNVSVYTGVILEDDVFCGPSMVFTNVTNPRSHIIRRHEYKRTLVKQGASLGANSTIVCGISVGRYAFVAAGAVVNRDVPDYALVAGVPARQIGWMCYCGIRLQGTGQVQCSSCSRRYSIVGDHCTELDGKAAQAVGGSQVGS